MDQTIYTRKTKLAGLIFSIAENDEIFIYQFLAEPQGTMEKRIPTQKTTFF